MLAKFIKLRPGLVLIKNCLSQDEQINLTNLILNQKHKFHKFQDEKQELNSTNFRGRIYTKLDKFSPFLQNKSHDILKSVAKLDNELSITHYTHSIILYYLNEHLKMD